MIGGRFGGLLRAAQSGDEAAFDELWRDLNPVLLRYLRAVVGDGRSDPEAVTADTWVDVARGLAAFHGDEATWRAWILRLARRRARLEARRLRWAESAAAAGPTGIAGSGTPPTGSAEPSAPALRARRGSVTVLRARTTLQDVVTTFALDLVATLPRLDREVLVLRAAGGLAVDDAARVVGRGRQTVRAAGYRAAVAVARSPQWGPPAPVAAAALNSAIEPIIAGVPAEDDSPIEVLRLADVVSALAACPTPAELVGSGPAYAAFYRYVGPGAVARGRSRVRLIAPLGTRIATGFAAAAVALGGTAAVAAAGALPGPLQDVAHDFFKAPARNPGGQPAPDRSPSPDGSSSGAASVPGPSGVDMPTGTSSSPAPSHAGTGRPRTTAATTPPPGASGALDPAAGVPDISSSASDPAGDIPSGSPGDPSSDSSSAPASPEPTPSDPGTSDTPSPGSTDTPSPTPGGGGPSTSPVHGPPTSPPGKSHKSGSTKARGT